MDVKIFNLYHMRLKKFIFCFCFLISGYWSYCQQIEKGSQSITLGYGLLSLYEIGAFNDNMNRANQATPETIEHFSGPVCVLYSYYVSRGISLGIAARYEWGTGSLYDMSSNYNDGVGTFKDNLFTAGPEMQIIYTHHYNYQCYGGVNISMTYRHRDINYYDYIPITERNRIANKWIPTGQVTFWGCHFGEGPLKGYIEIGMGYRGLVNGGIGYFFH